MELIFDEVEEHIDQGTDAIRARLTGKMAHLTGEFAVKEAAKVALFVDLFLVVEFDLFIGAGLLLNLQEIGAIELFKPRKEKLGDIVEAVEGLLLFESFRLVAFDALEVIAEAEVSLGENLLDVLLQIDVTHAKEQGFDETEAFFLDLLDGVDA